MKHLLYLLLISSTAVLFACCNDTNYAPNKSVKSADELEPEIPSDGYVEGLAQNGTYTWTGSDASGNSSVTVTPSDNATYEVNADVSAAGSSSNRTKDQKIPAYQRKLIRKADLKFETDSLSLTHLTLIESVKNLGGYVSSENQANGKYVNTAYLNLRVPSENFDALISVCDGLGVKNFDKREISASDVTEEFLDVSARIKTNKELEARYYDLLKMAKNVEEVIKVERELGKLRTIIETAEGRLKYLSDRVSLSTIKVEFYQNIEVPPTIDKRPNRLVRALSSGWNGLLSFLLVLVRIWPALIIGGVLFYIISKRLRGSYKKQK
ncbi:MAG: DUF4349 domain-containing protein [Flavobacteriales bacterium]